MIPLTRTTCEQVIRALDDYIDGELPGRELADIEAHLVTCANCLRKYRFERAFVTDVKQKLASVAMKAGLTERIRSELDRVKQTG